MENNIVNRVAESGLLTLDLAQFLPQEDPVAFDLAPFLFMGQMLREKDFREAMTQHNWTQYQGKPVAVFCSTDAIIPHWAYMLVSVNLEGIAASVMAGTPQEIRQALVRERMRKELDGQAYSGQRVVLKGCGDASLGADAYLEATNILKPHVKSLMYGEPCSTVPVFKKKS